MRELHWHPNADEWQYYLKGQGRMTVFASGGKARTFDYQAGDVGAVPFAMGHYIENTGDETLVFLEMFRSDHFADVSLAQWMGVLPPELVKAHLNLDDETDRRPAPHQADRRRLATSEQSAAGCRRRPRRHPAQGVTAMSTFPSSQPFRPTVTARRPTVGRRLATAVATYAFVVTMLATTLPTPLYELYRHRFGFSELKVTVIFAAYGAGVIATLLLFGSLSDEIGRRPVLGAGLALGAAGMTTFLFADGVPLLLVARLLSGLSAGTFHRHRDRGDHRSRTTRRPGPRDAAVDDRPDGWPRPGAAAGGRGGDFGRCPAADAVLDRARPAGFRGPRRMGDARARPPGRQADTPAPAASGPRASATGLRPWRTGGVRRIRGPRAVRRSLARADRRRAAESNPCSRRCGRRRRSSRFNPRRTVPRTRFRARADC